MTQIVGSPTYQNNVRQLETTDPKHPSTWNPNYQVLINNDVYLKQQLDELGLDIGDVTQQLGDLGLIDGVSGQKALTLYWLYSRARIAVELWGSEYTLLDILSIDVQSGIQGDDSVDVDDTSELAVDEEYVIFDAANRETFKVTQILTANRIRIATNLGHTYDNTAKVARTSMSIANGIANAVVGDTYFSKGFDIGSDNIVRAVIIRMLDNAANVRLFAKDAVATDWVEAAWSWKRTGDPVPAGYKDVEYLFSGNGLTHIKVVVEGATTTIKHIVAVPQETQLFGTHNPPVTPTNSYPANNATAIVETPTLALLSYSSPVNAPLAGVEFQVATAADGFGSPFVSSGELSAGLSYQVPAGRLAVSTDYWYRARVKDNKGAWSGWSAPTKFTTASSFVFVATPANTAPTAGQTNITETPTLTSSAFSVSGGSDTHASSQWQIRAADGDYAVPVWDSGTDAVNKTSIAVPAGELQSGTKTYYFRVRHTGTTYGNSQWSAETPFVTKENFGTIIGIALMSTGGGAGSWQRVDADGANKSTDAAFFNAHPTYSGVVAQTIDGQSMIKIPAFYYKAGAIASGPNIGKKALWISDKPQPGFVLHPAFYNAGSAIAQFWVGKYQATDDSGTKLGSASGVLPKVSMSLESMQSLAAARNTGGVTGFGVWSIYQLAAIQMLAMIEIGGSDAQSLIGYGHVTNSGVLNTDNATVAQATWRGIVGLWGNIGMFVDGIKREWAGKYKIWDRLGNKSYVTTSIYPPGTGYPITMSDNYGVDWDLRDVFLPKTSAPVEEPTSGTYADYFVNVTTAGEMPLSLGQPLNSGSGLFYYTILDWGAGSTLTGTRIAKV